MNVEVAAALEELFDGQMAAAAQLQVMGVELKGDQVEAARQQAGVQTKSSRTSVNQGIGRSS